jgi:hypothetical protein
MIHRRFQSLLDPMFYNLLFELQTHRNVLRLAEVSAQLFAKTQSRSVQTSFHCAGIEVQHGRSLVNRQTFNVAKHKGDAQRRN